jgi:hypothetical protein
MRRAPRAGVHAPGGITTFIVRVSRDESGGLQGVVERVATGLKLQFHGAAEISRLIEKVVVAEKDRRAT